METQHMMIAMVVEMYEVRSLYKNQNDDPGLFQLDEGAW